MYKRVDWKILQLFFTQTVYKRIHQQLLISTAHITAMLFKILCTSVLWQITQATQNVFVRNKFFDDRINYNFFGCFVLGKPHCTDYRKRQRPPTLSAERFTFYKRVYILQKERWESRPLAIFYIFSAEYFTFLQLGKPPTLTIQEMPMASTLSVEGFYIFIFANSRP